MNTARLKRITLLGFLSLFILFSLSGCLEEYTRKDIQKYVRDKCGIHIFRVAEAPVSVEDGEGYEDLVWTVYCLDGIEFHVMDDRYWGMESLSNTLRTDFFDVMMQYYAHDYEFQDLSLSSSENKTMLEIRVEGSYSSRQELCTLFRELEDFRSFLLSKGIPDEPVGSCRFNHENPLRYKNAATPFGQVLYDGDYTGWIMDGGDDYEAALNDYLLCCIDYQLTDRLEEFTDDEIREAVRGARHRLGISRSGEKDDYSYYDDLVSGRVHGEVSFGTMYQVLRREGMDVEGTPWDYVYRDKDGSEYRFSYDFCEYNPGGGEADTWCYYTKDGEKVWMPEFTGRHLTLNQIRSITGLEMTTKSPDTLTPR